MTADRIILALIFVAGCALAFRAGVEWDTHRTLHVVNELLRRKGWKGGAS